MEVFSASISVEPSQEAEFLSQFEQTTELWGESSQFLWSSLLRSTDSNGKFIICTGWNTGENQIFNEGLLTLTPFQQMFGRIEEFQSVETFENLPETIPVEHIPKATEESGEDEIELELPELPINLQTGKPINWLGDGEPLMEVNFPEASPLLQKTESSTMLAEFIGQPVSVWPINGQTQFYDVGILIACDKHWIRVSDGGTQTLMFPTTGVRLVKIHE